MNDAGERDTRAFGDEARLPVKRRRAYIPAFGFASKPGVCTGTRNDSGGRWPPDYPPRSHSTSLVISLGGSMFVR